jgi:hypothetical protein
LYRSHCRLLDGPRFDASITFAARELSQETQESFRARKLL